MSDPTAGAASDVPPPKLQTSASAAEDELDRRQWADLIQRITELQTDAASAHLPLYFCWTAALASAARIYVLEAKVRKVSLPLIGPLWNEFVANEERRLQAVFGTDSKPASQAAATGAKPQPKPATTAKPKPTAATPSASALKTPNR